MAAVKVAIKVIKTLLRSRPGDTVEAQISNSIASVSGLDTRASVKSIAKFLFTHSALPLSSAHCRDHANFALENITYTGERHQHV
ncbi:hypothetical protein BTUL_0260g00040 [Botrytis tulipae]|uniref:Uncharacterized protein n=1 Tax=Botrytis tulipae TaxID=87230 RepID=A0A4Z1EAH2_9HELO|nr:hypothetical protein BTUL_0260g00040 [Botrytis tulipae]